MRPPLFIIGTERSGSNLLRLMLNAHANIAIPHPPHILNFFAPLEAGYGDLHEDAAFRQLIQDVCGLLDVHIHPWEVRVDPERVFAEAPSRDVFGVYVAIHEQYRAWAGKARWGCKSTFMIHQIGRILQTFPDARLIWLIRDPRDVAVSSRTAVFSPCHPWCTAELWAREQALGLEWERRLWEGRIFRLFYEDLTADPEPNLRRLCTYAGEDFDPAMLQHHTTREAKTIAGLSTSWENAGKPVLRDNSRKYRKHLSEAEIRQVEGVTWGPMLALGYPPELATEPAPVPGLRELSRIRFWDQVWRTEVELQSLRNDRNHWRRWKRSLYLQKLRKKRA